MARPTPYAKSDFKAFEMLTTRWTDNDLYGHMNNAIHYELFDSTVNGFLIRADILNLKQSETVFLVVASGCDYFGEMGFPDRVAAGLRIAKLGSSSVRYEVGLFRNDEEMATAQGYFVHVHVDRNSRRPCLISPQTRDKLEPLVCS